MRHPPPALRRFLLLFVLDALAVIASYAWLDRPLARLFAHIAPGTDAVFAFITRFGISTGYLVIAASCRWDVRWRRGVRAIRRASASTRATPGARPSSSSTVAGAGLAATS